MFTRCFNFLVRKGGGQLSLVGTIACSNSGQISPQKLGKGRIVRFSHLSIQGDKNISHTRATITLALSFKAPGHGVLLRRSVKPCTAWTQKRLEEEILQMKRQNISSKCSANKRCRIYLAKSMQAVLSATLIFPRALIHFRIIIFLP